MNLSNPRRNIGLLRLFMRVLLVCALLVSSGECAWAKKSRANNKYASIVMDADTGIILSQSNADKTLHPASLTKMMTLLLAFEGLERGDISLKDRVPISANANRAAPSKLGLGAGASIRVEDAILALVTKSANDVAVALAEYLGGTESRFALMMTRRAQDIGMNRTVFRNASGLHHPAQVSTARDMARLARYIIVRYPHYYRYFSTRQFTYRGVTYQNHNKLLGQYAGMDGMKTGFIQPSGFNLVASAVRDGRRIIGVVFGGQTSKSRNDHMKTLLDQGFRKMDDIRIARSQIPLPRHKPDPGASPIPAYASLEALNPAVKSVQDSEETVLAQSDQTLESSSFAKVIGEGDLDPVISKRIETGLLAMAVHTGEYKRSPSTNAEEVANIIPASAMHAPLPSTRWSIQIGAYGSRAASDDALRLAQAKLPAGLNRASPLVVPLRTAEGMLFRARLAGFSRSEAISACTYFKSCMTIAPKAPD